jgi:TolA-binding protein
MTPAMPPRPHRFPALLALLPAAYCAASLFAASPAQAQATFAEEVAQASHYEPIVAGGEVDAAAVAKQAEEIEIIRQLARHRGGQPAALAQLIQMARPFSDDVAAELIDELAASHLHAGDLNLAAETRRVLSEQYPGTPRAQDALLWLVRLYASSEMVHAHREPSQAAQDMLQQLPPNADLTQARTNTALVPKQRRQKASGGASQPAAPYAVHLASQSMDRHPELADSAPLAYQRAVAARLAGEQKSAHAYLSPLKHRRPGDPWGDAARMESWLDSGAKDRAPKPTATVVFADDPPKLDGILAEPFWQLALPMPLQANDARATQDGGVELASAEQPLATPAPAPASQVQLAYDREYLYIAIVCEKAPSTDYPAGVGPRPRDGAMSSADHVSVRLDLDRDYASYYELLVDARGWTAERCWGDAGWNPEWYVAAAEANAASSRWIVEAAIPWSAVTPKAPKSGQAWACALHRTTPSATDGAPTQQSWQGAANQPESPAHFGVLQFE